MRDTKDRNISAFERNSADNLVRAASLYFTQLRAMITPGFCSINPLTQLHSVKNKFRESIKENMQDLPLESKDAFLEITETMLEISSERLGFLLPQMMQKLHELEGIYQRL